MDYIRKKVIWNKKNLLIYKVSDHEAQQIKHFLKCSKKRKEKGKILVSFAEGCLFYDFSNNQKPYFYEYDTEKMIEQSIFRKDIDNNYYA